MGEVGGKRNKKHHKLRNNDVGQSTVYLEEYDLIKY